MNLSEKALNKLAEKLVDQDTWINLGIGFFKIIIIVILAKVFIGIGKFAIHNFFKMRLKYPIRTSERRDATLEKLLYNVLAYLVYFISFVMILSIFDIDVKPILAGAGILGLAVGFGAQNLVRDIITGFFIILEDQFSVGDLVTIGQFQGTVEEIGLRTTKLKSYSGERHIIPNGIISEVTNFSIHNSRAIVDVGISYDEDIEHVERVIRRLLEKLPEKYEEIVMTPELLGVQNFGPSEVVLRIVAETAPTMHVSVSRIIRKEVKDWLDENGIEIPYPHMVMYSKNENQNKQKVTAGNKEG